MFAVVHFVDDESVECVPKSWLEGVCIHYLLNKIFINAYLYNKNHGFFYRLTYCDSI